ncbi:alcohol dehydrogenase 2-like [Myzus persicae]|uniref:alcohol dehydrogenase 2-like n=1 Tax=Myzus persicae TaxID=13164 RepID=UPI000B936AC1|nr:alcohol dehydrogenase 2-like [Myzus persicae]
MDVKGKYALVMDGTRGVGFLFAEELLKMNAGKVVITGLDERTGAEAVRDLNERYRPARAYFCQTDVTNPSPDSHKSDFEDMFKYINNNFGAMQIFFNNAEMHGSKDIIGTHMKTKIRGIILASKHMKNGVIVNHTSALGLDPNSQMIDHGAASAGIFAACMAFSKNKYFEKTKIRMMTICSELSQMSVGGAEEDRHQYVKIKQIIFYVRSINKYLDDN